MSAPGSIKTLPMNIPMRRSSFLENLNRHLSDNESKAESVLFRQQINSSPINVPMNDNSPPERVTSLFSLIDAEMLSSESDTDSADGYIPALHGIPPALERELHSDYFPSIPSPKLTKPLPDSGILLSQNWMRPGPAIIYTPFPQNIDENLVESVSIATPLTIVEN